jgi:hypothetical protein
LVTSPIFADTLKVGVIERLLLDVGAFGRREVAPLVGDADRRGDAADVLVRGSEVDDLLHEGLLVLRGDLGRILDHRRRPVVGVGRHRCELHVGLLRDRAGLGHFGGDARDPPQFVLRHDGAARESPDAGVDHANAEPRCSRTSAGASAAASSRAAAAAAPSAEPAPAVGVTIAAAAGVHARADAARKADVGVGAPGLLRLAEHDVGQALEGRGQRVAFRRLREQLADQIAGSQQQAGGTCVLEEISARWTHICLRKKPQRSQRSAEKNIFAFSAFSAVFSYTAGDTDVM